MLPAAYQNPPIVRANLVQGKEGEYWDADGSSRGISNHLDRDRLLALRELADVVVTDGKTARLERYRVPKGCDLAVITRTGYTPAAGNSTQRYLELRTDPIGAIELLKQDGYQRILLEVGPSLVKKLLASNLLDQLCLTNTQFSKARLETLNISHAELEFEEVIEDTTFTVWSQIQAKLA